MKTISIGLEDALLKEINDRARSLAITRAEIIRNALMAYLFRFDDIMDAQALNEAIAADEPRRPLSDVARKLKL